MRKPRALRPGDRLAVVAPASPFDARRVRRGVAELRALGLRAGLRRVGLRASSAIVAGSAERRAARDSSAPGAIRRSPALIARARRLRQRAAAAAARSRRGRARAESRSSATATSRDPHVPDASAAASWRSTARCSTGRLARGAGGLRSRLVRARAVPARADGRAARRRRSRRSRPGRPRGVLLGGTLTQLLASLGTPYRVRRRRRATCCSSTKSASGRIGSIAW